jgi:hypothetical protein
MKLETTLTDHVFSMFLLRDNERAVVGQLYFRNDDTSVIVFSYDLRNMRLRFSV